jgi:hypothetical protein
VRSVFRVVMFSHTKRIAATRKEIKEAIGAEYQAPVLDHVIRQAQARFEALCGFRMVEVAGARTSTARVSPPAPPAPLAAQRHSPQ